MIIRFYDLFAGIGGIRLGFEQACGELGIGHLCTLSNEINKDACKTYALNFGENPQGDIQELNNFPNCDFILAGFPCQAFSYAGRKKGFGDTRGTLFLEIERVIKALEPKPKGIILENVRGLITHDNNRTLKIIIAHLESLGYGVSHLFLNSCHFGVAQNRIRIYILALLGKKPMLTLRSNRGPADSHKFKQVASQAEPFLNYFNSIRVKDILEDEPNLKYRCSQRFIDMLSKVVGKNYEKLHGVRLIDYRGGNSIHSWELGLKGECTIEEMDFMNKLIVNRRRKVFGTHQDGKMLTVEQIKTFYNSPNLENIINSLLEKGYLRNENGRFNPTCGNMSFEVFKFLDPDSISITLVSSDVHRIGIAQNNIPRRITPRECARLQGFPDSFECHPEDTKAYRQFGNSVTVPVIKTVIKDFLINNWG